MRIDARGMTTEKLLGQSLLIMNDGNRATFLCDAGMGQAVVSRIRMRLSRLRATMDRKNQPRQHFRLNAQVYPYTNRQGFRSDCVVLSRVKTREHLLAESIERTMKNANVGTNAGSQNGTNRETLGGPTW